MSKLKTGVLAEPVLVGRESELEQLQRCFDSAIDGKGMTVFVSGEAGSGKTRLTTEFLNIAKKRGVAVLVGWCLSNAAVPYFPFVEAFNSCFSSGAEESLSPQPPEIGADLRQPELAGVEGLGITAWLTGLQQVGKTGKLSTLSPQVWKDQVFAAVAKTLHSISMQEPIVLFLEDIQWADSASIALLHYIARAITSERILVLATYRSEELTADAEGHPHPLAEEMRMMRREDLFKEINLPNLNQGLISKIAENMIGGNINSELAEKLAKESRGNALFVVETLRMLAERKSLIEENGQWRLSVNALGIPSKIKDIILRRLAVLKFNQRRILDAASVIGEKFDIELLGAVLGQDSLEVLETLNVIAQSTSLICVEESFYRFDHAKSQETLYAEIPLPLKRGYHAKVAEKLENTSKTGKLPLSDLAYHYAQAGNKEKAVKYASAAGKDALARFSNLQAIAHFTYVLQNVGEDPDHADERTSALEGLGDAFYANNMFKEAAKTFEHLANAGTGVMRMRAFRKAMEAAFYQGDDTHLAELLKKAEQYAALDRLESTRISIYKAQLGLGNLQEAFRVTEEALRVFEEEYSLWDAARVLMAIGWNLALLGKLEEGLTASLRAIAIFNEVGDWSLQMEAYNMAGQAFTFCGLGEEMPQMFTKAIEIDEKMKVGNYSKLVPMNASFALYLESCGDLAGAMSKSLKALEYSRKTDSSFYLDMVYAVLARQYTRLGDLKHAEEYIEKLKKLPIQSGTWSQSIHYNLTMAVFLEGKNQWKESAQYFKENFESLKIPGASIFEIPIRANYAWALDRQGRIEEAKTQLEEIQKLVEKPKKRFEHVNVQASLMAPIKVEVGQTFEARLDMVNVARTSGTIAKVEYLIPPEFKVTNFPTYCSLQNGSLDFKERKISPFQVETVKLTLQATEAGVFTLNPQVVYIDDLGETKTCKPHPVTINVQSAQPKFEVLPGRITTGYAELDALLLGGIPENYAILLASTSCDERELLVKKFLEAGAEAGETTFHITTETENGKALAKKYSSNFYLFLCNPRADTIIQNYPNVIKLKGVENLTEIDIAITKALRTLNPAAIGPKRICIEIVSDVLLQHHAVIARKWLSALLPDLKAKSFTTLAVVNPQMHSQEEVQAILGSFDGEIRVIEKETGKGTEQVLKIKKLCNQRYLENELTLTKEKIEA